MGLRGYILVRIHWLDEESGRGLKELDGAEEEGDGLLAGDGFEF